MYTVKATSSDNYDIIYLIFGDVVRFVIMDLSNHAYKTGSGCGWVSGVWVGVGYGWG